MVTATEENTGSGVTKTPMTLPDGTSVYLSPDDLEIEEIGDRIVGPDDDDLIMEIAASIEEIGQQEPVKISTSTGKNIVHMGRRRTRAIALINAGQKKGAEPLKVWCVVDNSVKDSFRAAVHENVHRKNYSALEFAGIVKQVRERYNWQGGKNTKNVADWLKVSVAQVTQHEKLLSLPKDVLDKGQKERLSAGAMIDLATAVLPEKRAEVIERAKGKAEQEAKESATRKGARKGAASTGASANVDSTASKSAKAGDEDEPAEPETGKIKRKHVIEAAREAEALTKPKSRAKSEIVEFFEQVAISPAYGQWANSPVRAFATFFVDKFVAGTGTAKTCRMKFDQAVMDDETGRLYAGDGTPSKTEMNEAEAEKEAESKTKTKAKAKAKPAAKTVPKTTTAGKSK